MTVRISRGASRLPEGPGTAVVPFARMLLVFAVGLLVLGGLSGCEAPPPPSADVPAGSLHLLALAAEEGDWGKMLEYMDPVKVGTTFAQATIARLEDDGDEESSGGSAGPHSGGAFVAGPMVTGFTDAFVSNLQTNAENGTLLAEGNLMRVILDGGLGETEYVSDNEAVVEVTLPAADGEGTPVGLRMVRDGEHWKLIAVEETTDLYGVLF